MGCVLTGLVYNLSPGSDKSAKYSSHPPDLVLLDLVYVCVCVCMRIFIMHIRVQTLVCFYKQYGLRYSYIIIHIIKKINSILTSPDLLLHKIIKRKNGK
jgi:hypothetical protein